MQNGYDYKDLVNFLRSYKAEEDWFEFKVGNSDAEKIGCYVSALSNSACLSGHSYGYLVWGIEDVNHDIVGTEFIPNNAKKGNQELLGYLVVNTSPRLNLDFITLEMEGKRIVILEIPAATNEPVKFKGIEYFRIGSTLRELKNYPEYERSLWRRFDLLSAEMRVVDTSLKKEDLARLLAMDEYYLIQNLPIPTNLDERIKTFESEEFIIRNDNGTYSITALGALLFARDIRMFPSIASKAFRIILYSGKGRVDAVNDITVKEGYAISFESMASTVQDLLKRGEIIGGGLRKDVTLLPVQAVREVMGNMIIHQDLSSLGSSPLLEIFEDRAEGTSPGSLLVPKERIIDAPSKARNEKLASFLRRLHIAEERGSGFDRIEEAMAMRNLPSAMIENGAEYTRIKLFSSSDFSTWTHEDKLRTIYYYTCLKYIESGASTNSSLRERLGIKNENSAIISRLVKDAISKNLIKIEDENVGTKARRYLPYWA